ncbi:(Na+)-NQR maturation NqrM [Aliamphritea spongicola]|uniref:(Na+)-NQR maturation NqrM n=1 Tax=Aliamphritea spongicola TaxID=707589 RepID=UPI00196B9F99|nr:(Na+)-NQR maturation NqrM [Aliamphritea spongicola]MBN3560616.1 (Na+)-NQR maturation NqrM [Aliamphritea spongicola]
MTELIFAIVIMLLLVAGMAIGVILKGKPITGSCGGMSALGMDTACDVCGGNQEICETEQQKKQSASADAADLGYQAK